MDDKINEGCKTCEKQCMQGNLDGSRGLKTVFQWGEKYRCEYNQACYSTKDPNNILNS